jgi:autotransporter-associated beta strand protein
VLNGGTLRYSGSDTSTQTAAGTYGRGFTIGANGGTLESAATSGVWRLISSGGISSSSGGTLTLSGTSNGQLDKSIPGSGGLTKTGSGTWTLTASNGYTGATTVQQGTLALSSSGTITSSSNLILGVSGGTKGTLDVTAQATSFTQTKVSGNGTMNIGSGKTISISTTLAPGFSLGVATGELDFTGNLSLASTTATTMELAGTVTAGTDYDYIKSTGSLALAGTLNIAAVGSYDLNQPGTYNLFQAGSYSGDFSSVNVGGIALTPTGSLWNGVSGATTYQFNDTTGVLTVVPEPGAWVSLLGGCGVLLGLRRRRC